MKNTTAPTWDHEAYRAAKVQAGKTYRDIHRELVALGWDFTLGTVRQWGMTGSPGPKHPTTLKSLRAILPALPR